MEPNLENLYLSSELTLCKKVHSSFFFVTTKNLATGSGTKLRDKFVLKVMETTDLPKPIKMAFKTMDIITKNSEVLFRRLELLNPGIKTTLEAYQQTSRLQRTAAHPAYRSGVSKDPEKDESSCLHRCPEE